MTPDEAYTYALEHAARNPDGGINEKSLADLIAENVDFDANEARLAQAKRIVTARKRPGRTSPQGQMTLPGMEPYDYEPFRLVADDVGNVIENARARPNYKLADARRAQQNAQRTMTWAARKQDEAARFAEWAYGELATGRAAVDISFDVFVREAGFWQPVDVAQDADTSGTDETEDAD